MKKKKKTILVLSIFLLFNNILLINIFFGSSLHTNNKTIIALPSTSNTNIYEWHKTWGGSHPDSGEGITLDDSGNAFITGFQLYNIVGFRQAKILKFDSSGNLLWSKAWGSDGYSVGDGIALDDSGNAFITGYTNRVEEENCSAFLLKYDSSGNLLWSKTWGGSGYDFGKGITLDDSGNAFITGYTNSYGAGESDMLLLKYNSSGNLLWYKAWGGSGSDFGEGITLDDSGNAFITGYTNSYGAGESDMLLLKYDSSGNLLWYKTWGGSDYVKAYGIALDDSENAFITGFMSAHLLGDYDGFLLKFGLDTDDDGFTDREEINSGTDPLNFFDNWPSRGVITFVILSSSITVLIVFYVFKRKKKVNQKNVIIKKGVT